MSRSRIFLYFCLAFIVGIAVSSFVFISQLWQLVFLIVGIFLISLFWGRKKIILAGFCLLFLSLGAWRHQTALSEIVYPQEGEITFEGVVAAEPDIRTDNIKLIMEDNPVNDFRLAGKILVTASRYPEYQYGDELKIKGKLLIPENFDNFDYRAYLAKDGIYSVMYYPEIEVLSKKNPTLPSVLYGKILQLKESLRKSIYENIIEPEASISVGIILGDQRRMSAELQDKLNITGLRHTTAVSGTHVTTISLMLMQFLLALGFWRGQAFYLTLLFLLVFVVMVGLPASAVRAGLMAGAFLFAQKIGRASSSFRLLVFVAVLMLALNPLLLKSDIGFQLSFLAVAGMIFLGPRIERRLKIIPEGKLLNLRSMIVMTLSAQVFTLPILIFNFGRISLVSILTNILVLPIQPSILANGFAAGLAGLVWQPLGWLLGLPLWLQVSYMMKIIDWFSILPLAAVSF